MAKRRKLECPANIKSFEDCKTFEDLIREFHSFQTGESFDEHLCPRVYFSRAVWKVNGNHMKSEEGCSSECVIFSMHGNASSWWRLSNFTLVYFDDSGNQWNLDIGLISKEWIYGYTSRNKECEMTFNSGSWKCENKIMSRSLYVLLNTDDDISSKLNEVNPYGAAYYNAEINNGQPEIMLMAPWLEQLSKAGYVFAKNLLFNRYELHDRESIPVAELKRLVKNGNSPKEIFKTDKPVYDALKDCGDLKKWDLYRKMYKKGRIKNVQDVVDAGYNETDLNKIDEILRKTWEGKPVFTWDTLQRYLDRVDHFEAIPFYEAVQLLKDYLNMTCNVLKIKPKLDGDSLKREHDVTARTCWQKRNEIMAQKMAHACEVNKKYDYEDEGLFFGRAIRSYDDLLDEAMQQHNCVGGYASSIANNRSIICVVRTKEDPNKSLATVEFSPDGTVLRQKYLAYNRPIHNSALTEFINRYHKFIKNMIEVA